MAEELLEREEYGSRIRLCSGSVRCCFVVSYCYRDIIYGLIGEPFFVFAHLTIKTDPFLTRIGDT